MAASGTAMQVFDLTPVRLAENMAYYVTVVAFNKAGPRPSTNTSSGAVYVETTGPTAGVVYNT